MVYLFVGKKKAKQIRMFVSLLLLLTISALIGLGYQQNFAHALLEKELLYQTSLLNDYKKNEIAHLTDAREKVAYLTFDDGPTVYRKSTATILDILKKNDVKATFFVVGSNVEKYPDLVKREYEEGHFIANHTYSHQDHILYKSKESFLFEIVKTDQAIGKAIGVEHYRSHLFRFPGGSGGVNHEKKKEAIHYLEEIDYTYVDWNSLNNDAVHKYSDQELLENLKKNCKGKNTLIILMHDAAFVNKTYNVLEDSIAYLKEEGYTFRTFQDIIRESP